VCLRECANTFVWEREREKYVEREGGRERERGIWGQMLSSCLYNFLFYCATMKRGVLRQVCHDILSQTKISFKIYAIFTQLVFLEVAIWCNFVLDIAEQLSDQGFCSIVWRFFSFSLSLYCIRVISLVRNYQRRDATIFLSFVVGWKDHEPVMTGPNLIKFWEPGGGGWYGKVSPNDTRGREGVSQSVTWHFFQENFELYSCVLACFLEGKRLLFVKYKCHVKRVTKWHIG